MENLVPQKTGMVESRSAGAENVQKTECRKQIPHGDRLESAFRERSSATLSSPLTAPAPSAVAAGRGPRRSIRKNARSTGRIDRNRRSAVWNEAEHRRQNLHGRGPAARRTATLISTWNAMRTQQAFGVRYADVYQSEAIDKICRSRRHARPCRGRCTESVQSRDPGRLNWRTSCGISGASAGRAPSAIMFRGAYR